MAGRVSTNQGKLTITIEVLILSIIEPVFMIRESVTNSLYHLSRQIACRR